MKSRISDFPPGNEKVAMVKSNELLLLTGYVMGGCSPISFKPYKVYIYEDALNHEKIGVNAGARGLMFYMSTQDLAKVAKASFGKIAKKKQET